MKIILFLFLFLLIIIQKYNYQVISNGINHFYSILYSFLNNFTVGHKCKIINNDILKCYDGHKLFYCNKKDSSISNNLRAGIPWEKFMHKYFKKYSNKNKIALDIGANIGTSCIHMANHYSQVHAFEPQKKIFNLLQSNIKINNCKNIIPHNFGLGNNIKKEKMEYYDKNSLTNQGGIGIDKNGNKNGETIYVQPLDELNLSNIALIKIDVEGYEYNVLLGGKNTITSSRPYIIIELNIKSKNDHNNIINFFKQINYKLTRISPDDYLAEPL
jgi:FkbM family methyltransferase